MRALVLIVASAAAWAGTKHDFPRPVLVFANHPDLPIENFAAGRLGIPQPGHARIYLYAAYRYLDGRPFTPAEQRAYMRAWRLRAGIDVPHEPETGYREWRDLRWKVSGKPRPQEGVETRGFVYRPICSDDAFAMAARTLRERIQRFGNLSPEVRFWVEGQDLVFEGCSPGQKIPAPAPPAMHSLIRADRDYQIAAALFYNLRFDEALERFRLIEKDAASPWRVWAPYLIGRTFLWMARMTQAEPEYHKRLREAEKQFLAVLANPALRVTHAAADRLLIRCLLITNPRRGLERLARRLDNASAVATRSSDLFMYLNSIDMHTGGYDEPRKTVEQILPNDNLTQWTYTFQGAGPSAYTTALARWRATASRAWLYSAIYKARASSPERDELIRVALAVPVGETGGPAIRYAAARLLALTGDVSQARDVLDGVLAELRDLPSALNIALEARAQVARDLDEFLKLAPRRVIMASTELDDAEFESAATPGRWYSDRSEIAQHRRLAGLPRLDGGAEVVLSRRLPLRLLRDIALAGTALPKHLTAELRLAAFTRAALLGRIDVARELGGAVASDHPSIKAEMQRFLDADPAKAEAEAAFVLAKLPGAKPYMSRGYGRALAAHEHDEWGRNWWHRLNDEDMSELDYPNEIPVRFDLPELPFLSAADRQEAAAEWKRLAEQPEGYNWIAGRIVRAVREQPGRPGAAESLYRAISVLINNWHSHISARESPELRAAARLLSTRYRNTSWYRKAAGSDAFWLQQLMNP